MRRCQPLPKVRSPVGSSWQHLPNYSSDWSGEAGVGECPFFSTSPNYWSCNRQHMKVLQDLQKQDTLPHPATPYPGRCRHDPSAENWTKGTATGILSAEYQTTPPEDWLSGVPRQIWNHWGVLHYVGDGAGMLIRFGHWLCKCMRWSRPWLKSIRPHRSELLKT